MKFVMVMLSELALRDFKFLKSNHVILQQLNLYCPAALPFHQGTTVPLPSDSFSDLPEAAIRLPHGFVCCTFLTSIQCSIDQTSTRTDQRLLSGLLNLLMYVIALAGIILLLLLYPLHHVTSPTLTGWPISAKFDKQRRYSYTTPTC